MYFTRFDVKSVSGVPGVIFALGSCGAATLKLHGPVGLHGFLGAIRSFVRRKYPQLQSIEITGPSKDQSAERDFDESIQYDTWGEGSERIDQHALILPIALGVGVEASSDHSVEPQCCNLCEKNAPRKHIQDMSAEVSSSTVSTNASQRPSNQVGRRLENESDEHEQVREWLVQYYTEKVPAKLPYIDVVLNRYRGRYGDLKSQLCAKQLDRRWMEKFYAEFQPDKLVHIDRVLRQFSGREDTLKGMLLKNSLCYVVQLQYAPYPVVWIIDCRTSDHIFDLERKFSVTAASSYCEAHLPSLVVHLSPAHVQAQPRYKQWMTNLSLSTSRPEQLVFDGTALQSVAQGVFSYAFVSSAKVASPCRRQVVKHIEGCEAEAHVAQSKLQFCLLHPKNMQLGFNYERTGKLIVLGTGSAAPSKLRASSGIYLELSGTNAADVESMLVDCGEGTYGQLWRQFGDEVAERIGGLRCIWISHNHADHHCGLVRVLYEFWYFHMRRKDGNSSHSLVVVAPQSVLSYVESWLPQFLRNDSDYQLIRLATCETFNNPRHPLRCQLLAEISYAVTSITSVRVFHCYDSYGLVLTLQGGKKLVYSGDTKPCNDLVLAGMGAELLVHEATFDDSMEQDAKMKKHSTVGQALDIAQRMRARQVILTHFSQRYPALPPPVLDSSERSSIDPATVLCAYDGFVHPMPF
ncbi:zinc phosphodiesterase, putative [Phytophthora infestans T30-4]|uniref:ribonuclease Z n=1 Tax=Phytophthora infestans (strain T30-4) TaxID=403677 RepID=D0MYW6_PHYIT|nr:zinc phosphodiesterase, putative [Phytophthora infestans T30-4]EEY66364.1 zinc phosphodiesterase, putative [Phytophthora infestans T30-4]|eukprot:XP_002906963.1 zinc phosphodiesterase, putative [Phytophthora infestans T30-4]